jgi:iron complex outermembrane receptor protein
MLMDLRRSLPFAAWMAMTSHALPQTAPATNLYEAPPVVVTATRAERAPERIPAQISVITADQLRDQGARHVVDALQSLAGVPVRSLSGNPAQAEIALRGFGENAHGRTLVLRDGQRLNTPDMAGINWLQIPVSAVSRIEVIEGPQSVLYGDHALGGVVNIVTHDASRPAGTEAGAAAGSHGTFGASLATRRPTGRLRYSAGADWQTSDGFRRNGDYESVNLRAGADAAATETLRLALFGTYDRLENGLPGALTREQMDDDPRQTVNPGDEATTESGNASLALQWEATADQRLMADLIVNRREAESDFVSWFSFPRTTLDSLTLTLRHQIDSSLLARPTRLLGGIDVYLDRLDADRFTDSARTLRLLDAVVDKSSYGAYLNHETDLAERLTLSLGGRLEQARYAAEVGDAAGATVVDDSETHTVSALAASLLYRPADEVKLYASLSTLYRLPFLDEQVSYYGFGTDTFYEALDPETGTSGEVGGAWRLAPGWLAEASLYRLDMEDEIAYNPLTGDNDNLDKTRHQGGSAALGWQRADLGSVKVRYSYTDAEFRGGVNDGCQVPLVPRHHFNLAAQARLPLDLTLLATLHVSGSQPVGGDNGNRLDTLSSYATLDLGLRYQPARLPDLSLLVGVDNVFDEAYANVAYAGFAGTGYYPAAGRTWKSALAYAF